VCSSRCSSLYRFIPPCQGRWSLARKEKTPTKIPASGSRAYFSLSLFFLRLFLFRLLMNVMSFLYEKRKKKKGGNWKRNGMTINLLYSSRYRVSLSTRFKVSKIGEGETRFVVW
jgi:hypothetical protein